jgi:hypothetical protein
MIGKFFEVGPQLQKEIRQQEVENRVYWYLANSNKRRTEIEEPLVISQVLSLQEGELESAMQGLLFSGKVIQYDGLLIAR